MILLFPLRDRLDALSSESLQTLLSRPSIVVLPFRNVSGDDSMDNLAFGLWDETIVGLQLINRFPVRNRHVSLEFPGSGQSPAEFMQSHNAAYRLEGTINADGDILRLTATLFDSADAPVWGNRFIIDSTTTSQFDLADQLVSMTAARILDSEIERVGRESRPPADAYERYLSGLRVVWDFDPGEYAEARQFLLEAVEIDQNFADAWWALGELEVLDFQSKTLAAETGFEELEDIIERFRRAHDISAFHGAACGCIGYLQTSLGRMNEARAMFEQSIEANPVSADLRHNYAFFLLVEGRYEEAVREVDLAETLGVRRAYRAEAWIVRSIAALAAGNESDALDAVSRALNIDDQDPLVLVPAIALRHVLGQRESAESLGQDVLNAFPGISAGNPMLSGVVRPIDEILASRGGSGDDNGPATVADILGLLRAGAR